MSCNIYRISALVSNKKFLPPLRRSYIYTAFIFLWLALLHLPAHSAEKYRFFAEGTLYDSPFLKENGTYTAPSMQQAVELTTNFYQLSHIYLQKLTDDKVWQITINAVFDAILMIHPSIWLHEEHHRAVMARRGINSRNESYFLHSKEQGGVIKVSGVKDSDLVRLKRDYPAEIIHMHTAGMVSSMVLMRHIESRWFFHETESLDYGALWSNALGNYSYMKACTKHKEPEVPTETEDERDFTGFDCRAWVYDMFRPDEPYETRGVHRTGQGIDRYITYAKLTSEERDYLSKAANLYLINFIDPHLFGFHRIEVGEYAFNFAGRHSMAPFGQMSALDFYFDTKTLMLRGALYHNTNENHSGVGVEVALIRYPVSSKIKLTPQLIVQQQPKKMSFYNSMETVADGSLKADWEVSSNVELFGEARYKTAGWTPGTVYLDRQTILRAGLNIKF